MIKIMSDERLFLLFLNVSSFNVFCVFDTYFTSWKRATTIHQQMEQC